MRAAVPQLANFSRKYQRKRSGRKVRNKDRKEIKIGKKNEIIDIFF